MYNVNDLTGVTQQYAKKQQINSCKTNNAIATATPTECESYKKMIWILVGGQQTTECIAKH